MSIIHIASQKNDHFYFFNIVSICGLPEKKAFSQYHQEI